METKEIFKVTSAVWELRIYEDHICISYFNMKGLRWLYGENSRPDLNLFYQDIISVKTKKPTLLVGGYIQFDNKLTKDEEFTRIYYPAKDKEKIEEISKVEKYVLSKIFEAKQSSNKIYNITDVNIARELTEYQNLLYAGVINREEFEKLKKNLLK